jgi:hypothetical protein
VLPYAEFVDWRQSFVWIPAEEIESIGEILRHHHDRLSPAEFLARQQRVRQLYEEWICPLGFFQNLWRYVLE